MIQVRYRFHGHGSLRPVYERGSTVRGSTISLKYLKRKSGTSYRAAVVVSRKVHKSAVVRNRIRRRIYELVRQADSSLTEGKDLILTVFSDQIAEMDAAKLHSQIEGLLKKAVIEPKPDREHR